MKVVEVVNNAYLVKEVTVNPTSVTYDNVEYKVQKFLDEENDSFVFKSFFQVNEEKTAYTQLVLMTNKEMNKVLSGSHCVYGMVNKNVYMEDTNRLLIPADEFMRMTENIKQVFGAEADKLISAIVANIMGLGLNMDIFKDIPESLGEIKRDIAEFKSYSIYTEINLLHLVVFNHFVENQNLNNNPESLIHIKYLPEEEEGQKAICELIDGRIVLKIKKEFYQGSADIVSLLPILHKLILAQNVDEYVKPDMPKIEMPTCGKGEGCCKNTGKSCDDIDLEDIDEVVTNKTSCADKSGCCSNKPATECCKTSDNPCNCKTKKIEKEEKEVIFANKGFCLYMKGTKDEPKCKFSRAAVERLNALGVSYETCNILEEPDMREKLKETFPTFPQFWHKDKFVCNGDGLQKEDVMDLFMPLEIS